MKELDKKAIFIRILGDDLLAFWPVEVDKIYTSLLGEVGLPISKSKHLVSPKKMIFARNMFIPILEERERDSEHLFINERMR
jgi:hypothetical protein